MTRVDKKTCQRLKTESLAFHHNKTARTLDDQGSTTQYSADTLQHVRRFFHWGQHDGNNFAQTGRPAVAALADTINKFNGMLETAKNGPFPNLSNSKKKQAAWQASGRRRKVDQNNGQGSGG
jgi:hypothetical protein